MKIAIASDDRNTISPHFGRALGFVVFDIDRSKVLGEEYRRNVGKNKGACGTCDHQAMIRTVKDCEQVICQGMGQSIFDDLLRNSITAVVTDERTVKGALNKFMRGGLRNRLDKLH
ncbi:MAG: NifB/NifX family molybdenum-iron cluster-binding protein [archaeon]